MTDAVGTSRRLRPWLRWALAINGCALILLGSTCLTVSVVLPRALALEEQAQGIGIFDPRTGQDLPMTPVNHATTVTLIVSLLFVVGGALHVAGALLCERSSRRILRALILLGSANLAVTSIPLGILALRGLARSDVQSA